MVLSNRYDGPRTAGAVGSPLAGVECDVVDEHGVAIVGDAPGELRVRSTQMFSRYHNDEDATRRSFDEHGRFKTGDTVSRDETGTFRILGRTSTDIVKSGGYKLSALEIEESLRAHEAIADVAIVGVPDAEWGERVSACVVLRAGATLSIEELRTWAKERMATYKVPRELRVMDSLPRNAMGKVMKGALRG
jgi:malonyl-CoA/methylmalonyl-CoA synthetase